MLQDRCNTSNTDVIQGYDSLLSENMILIIREYDRSSGPLIKQVLKFIHIGDMDLPVLDIDELFRFEIAEGSYKGFGGGADVLGDVFAGDRKGHPGCIFRVGGSRGEPGMNIQQAFGNPLTQ